MLSSVLCSHLIRLRANACRQGMFRSAKITLPIGWSPQPDRDNMWEHALWLAPHLV
ncbi:hypothetical protein LIA77_05364 [Sarocladium implicatum]|nr:hypothetical protein LIA77_05364 [Sarocladium implicatum]